MTWPGKSAGYCLRGCPLGEAANPGPEMVRQVVGSLPGSSQNAGHDEGAMSDGNEHASQRTSDARRSATPDAAPPVPPPPPRPREVDKPPADGSADGRRFCHRVRRIQCPMCRPYSTAGELRMLLAHVSTAHSGEVINAQARAAFSALGRGSCTTEGCGALRAFDGQPQCRKCRRRAPVRELSEGDVAPGNSSRPEAPSQAGNKLQRTHPEMRAWCREFSTTCRRTSSSVSASSPRRRCFGSQPNFARQFVH